MGHIQCIASYVVFMSDQRFDVKRLATAGGECVYEDSHGNTEYNRMCSENVDRSLRKSLATLALVLISFTGMSVGPTYVLIMEGEFTKIIMCLKIPFVEAFSTLEYLFNVAIQTLAFVTGFPGNIGIEGTFALLIDSITASTTSIQWQCKRFTHRNRQLTSMEQKMEIVRILQQIRTVDR